MDCQNTAALDHAWILLPWHMLLFGMGSNESMSAVVGQAQANAGQCSRTWLSSMMAEADLRWQCDVVCNYFTCVACVDVQVVAAAPDINNMFQVSSCLTSE